jgi:hypothetical protein
LAVVIPISHHPKPGSILFFALPFIISGVFIWHRCYPTKMLWILSVLFLFPELLLLIVTVPMLFKTSEYIEYALAIFVILAICVSFSVVDARAFLHSPQRRLVMVSFFILYTLVIWLAFGVERVANDHEIGVQHEQFIKTRLSFKIYHQNPAWQGLDLVPHTSLTLEKQKEHVEYCEIRFAASSMKECDKRFIEQLR